jgi:glutamate N-acetyltransferase/amino-acid N-acetyltransferase
VTSTVNLPQGFRAAGVTAGLKASGRSDLALVVNDGPDHHAAAVFTSNRVEAAPVTWSRQVVSDGRVDAVILNSGGANACTGSPGFLDTHRTAEKVARSSAFPPATSWSARPVSSVSGCRWICSSPESMRSQRP